MGPKTGTKYLHGCNDPAAQTYTRARMYLVWLVKGLVKDY